MKVAKIKRNPGIRQVMSLKSDNTKADLKRDKNKIKPENVPLPSEDEYETNDDEYDLKKVV